MQNPAYNKAKMKSPDVQPADSQEELLTNVLKLLDKLYSMRLVERISRPISKANK